MSNAQIARNARTTRSSRIRSGVKLAGGAAFALTLSLSSAGLAGADPIVNPGMDRTTLSDGAQDDALEYWTEERMEEATPADELVDDKAAAPAEVERSADPLKVPSVAPRDVPQTAAETVPGDETGSDHIGKVFAFAKVESETGSGTLADAVGASGIAFNEQRGLEYSAYGYPADVPFDGESLEECHGTASDDTVGGTQSQGIDCDMTGGSSGGPWFIGGDDDGYQNSVNSFGYNTQPNTMYGPYFGDEAKQAYEEAEAL